MDDGESGEAMRWTRPMDDTEVRLGTYVRRDRQVLRGFARLLQAVINQKSRIILKCEE